MSDHLPLIVAKGEARIDTRVLAQQLGNQHQNVFELVKDYQPKFEVLGKVRFETGASPDSSTGQKEKFAMLNEDQAYFLLSLSRNTERVVDLKLNLTIAFGEARRAAIQHGAEYLPSYHQLHDQIHSLAAGSTHERFVHMNVNRLINKAAGIDSGQRGTVALPVQSLLSVAQTVAANAMHGASDHHTGYQVVKAQLEALNAMTQIGGAQ